MIKTKRDKPRKLGLAGQARRRPAERSNQDPNGVGKRAAPRKLSCRTWRSRPGFPRRPGSALSMSARSSTPSPGPAQPTDRPRRRWWTADAGLDVLDLHHAGLDLEEVENLVDDAQHPYPESRTVSGTSCWQRRLGFEERIGHPDHAVHGGPGSMAHIAPGSPTSAVMQRSAVSSASDVAASASASAVTSATVPIQTGHTPIVIGIGATVMIATAAVRLHPDLEPIGELCPLIAGSSSRRMRSGRVQRR